jgi:hypothetical protein
MTVTTAFLIGIGAGALLAFLLFWLMVLWEAR